MRIFFLTGKPACGKDTQAKLLARHFRATEIVTSQLLKTLFRNQKGKTIRIGHLNFDRSEQLRRWQAGQLIASHIVTYVLGQRIERAIKKQESLIISGSPRKLWEAQIYLKLLKNFCQHCDFHFIELVISNQEVIRRALGRHRGADDALLVIKRRLKVYEREVVPAIKYLAKKKILIRVLAEGKPKKILSKIITRLKK